MRVLESSKRKPFRRPSMGLREFRSLGMLRELQFPELLSLSVRRHGALLTFLAGVLTAGLIFA